MANDLYRNDRSFNDEVVKQRNMFVAEHNDLIAKADYDLTARELKIMDFLISRIKPEDETFNVIYTSLYEIANVLGLQRSGQVYNQIADNLRSLRRKEVMILDQGKNGRSITFTGWINDPTFHENGQVEVLISEKFMPFLLDLRNSGNYTQYLLFDTVKLKSKYSIRLYKLMRESDKHRGKIMPVLRETPEKLSILMSAPEAYNSWGRLNDKVIKPAIDEINLEIDDMQLELHTKKRGRRVIEVEICNTFYPIQQDKENEVPLFNWLDKSQ